MIKLYCDCCGVNITDKNKIGWGKDSLSAEIKTRKGSAFILRVIIGEGNSWESADFCKYCVIDALNKADDRVKEGCR